jgi:hypothetical protein
MLKSPVLTLRAVLFPIDTRPLILAFENVGFNMTPYFAPNTFPLETHIKNGLSP